MTGTWYLAALETIATPVARSSGDTTITLAPFTSASSTWEIWAVSLPWALLAITLIAGLRAWTAAMKSGLSWSSKREAHVEQGMTKAIFSVAAAVVLASAPELASASAPAHTVRVTTIRDRRSLRM